MPKHGSERVPLLKIPEVATRLGVHPRTIDRWISQGRLATFQIGPRCRRILETDLERFLESARVDLWEQCAVCGRSLGEPGGMGAAGLPLCPGCAGGGGR
jgi:excisionase family DNA binding protein